LQAKVSIIKCSDYIPSDVLKAVKEAVDLLGGIDRFVQPGQNVLVKPNLLSPHPPEAGVCAHPAVVEWTIGLAMACGAECAIGDCPSIRADTPEGYEHLLEVTGMREVMRKTGAKSIRLDDSSEEREMPGAKVFKRLPVAAALSGFDSVINICKFKTHELTLLTGAVKNLYGLIPGRRKIQFHLQAGNNPEMFAQILVDLLRGIRPTLSIMDGIVGMDGQGPSAGRRRNFGVILASEDPVALDAVACAIAGVDPMIVPTLRLANEQGVGVADLSRIEIVGAAVDEVRIDDFMLPPRGDIISRLPKPLYRMLRNHMVRKPVFDRAKCTDCRSCVRTCPVHAIDGEGKRLRIDYTACIRCYCCQEVCPEKAIPLVMSPLRNAIEGALAVRRAIRDLIGREGSTKRQV